MNHLSPPPAGPPGLALAPSAPTVPSGRELCCVQTGWSLSPLHRSLSPKPVTKASLLTETLVGGAPSSSTYSFCFFSTSVRMEDPKAGPGMTSDLPPFPYCPLLSALSFLFFYDLCFPGTPASESRGHCIRRAGSVASWPKQVQASGVCGPCACGWGEGRGGQDP